MGNKRGALLLATTVYNDLNPPGKLWEYKYASPLPTNQVRELGSLHTNTSQSWVQGSSMAWIPWGTAHHQDRESRLFGQREP